MEQAKLCIHNQAEVQTDKLPEGEGQREQPIIIRGGVPFDLGRFDLGHFDSNRTR